MADAVETSDRIERLGIGPALVKSMRPKQWLKNTFVFAGVVFSGNLSQFPSLVNALSAFAIFCALSSSVYLLNDVMDRKADQHHPRKSQRPIASGAVSPGFGVVAALLLTSGALAWATQINGSFLIVSAAYFTLATSYSLGLKNILLLDVIVLAMGFVLRAVAGAFAVEVEASAWLVLLTILVASFFGLTKRRHELILLGDKAQSHRAIFDEYSEILLDQLISVVSAATLVSYALYTFFSDQPRHLELLVTTFPIVLYALFRYLYLVYRKDLGGDPEELLIHDRPLAASGVLWVVVILLVIYWPV